MKEELKNEHTSPTLSAKIALKVLKFWQAALSTYILEQKVHQASIVDLPVTPRSKN